MSNLYRRQATLALGAFSASLLMATGTAMANDTSHLAPLTLAQSLQSVLRDIGTAPCIALADRLEDDPARAASITLHLRRAGIDQDGAVRIAHALASVSELERAKLRSFSLSYNAIGDGGAATLATALPTSLGELGLVGCSIGDEGGEAILHWAQDARGLGMICIEGNAMSADMRQRFLDLRASFPQMAVFA